MFPNRAHIQDETRTLYMVTQERPSALRIHLYISTFSVRHTGIIIRLRLMKIAHTHTSLLTLRTKENQKRRKHNI